MLIIQCDSGDKKGDLIDCARFCIMEEYQRARQMVDKTKNCQKKRDVLILMQLPRVAGGCFVGFQVCFVTSSQILCFILTVSVEWIMVFTNMVLHKTIEPIFHQDAPSVLKSSLFHIDSLYSMGNEIYIYQVTVLAMGKV